MPLFTGHSVGNKEVKHYLIGAPFIIQTDHKPLEWLESSKSSLVRRGRNFAMLMVLGTACL